MRRVRAFLDSHCDAEEPLALCGDLNIAPDARDVYDPDEWGNTVLFHPEMRAAFQSLCEWGLTDTFRCHHSEEKLYSWLDYRQLAFPKNRGVRIDHILAAQSLAECCTRVEIDREARKGKGASDHAPVIAEFDD